MGHFLQEGWIDFARKIWGGIGGKTTGAEIALLFQVVSSLSSS